jgi:hypothetical protein
METNAEPIKEVLDDLFALLETLETQNIAVVQFLKDQGIATNETFAPYLERAGAASSVKWRAARARMTFLLAPAPKKSTEPEKETKDKEAEAKEARTKNVKEEEAQPRESDPKAAPPNDAAPTERDRKSRRETPSTDRGTAKAAAAPEKGEAPGSSNAEEKKKDNPPPQPA